MRGALWPFCTPAGFAIGFGATSHLPAVFFAGLAALLVIACYEVIRLQPRWYRNLRKHWTHE